MADLKISQLTGATTPLAGTEVLPIVQSASTVKVSVENVLNYGKINLNATAAPTPGITGTAFQVVQADGVQNYVTAYAFGAVTNRFVGIRANGTNAAKTAIASGNALAFFGGSGYGATAYANAVTGYMNVRASEAWTDSAWGTELAFVYTANGGTTTSTGMLVNGTGITASLGNFVPATAGRGVNFTANTPAAGMTSQLLSWYEEGTWTPTLAFGGGSTGITYDTRAGTYTRVGRTVTFRFEITLTNKGSSTGAAEITGLPFSAANLNAVSVYLYSNFDAVYKVGIAYAFGTAISEIAANGTGFFTDAQFTNTSRFWATCTYQM